jgi:VIT1/CCC1 family predicted Fe2+/Mn2+ transporter
VPATPLRPASSVVCGAPCDSPDRPVRRALSPLPGGAEVTEVERELPPDAQTHLLSTSVGRLNRLRAAVLGANDGVLSTAGLIVGVAGASASSSALAIAGVAGLAAGALSMGGGEYTSVRAQRDSHEALLERQRHELAVTPAAELDELTHLYREKGLPNRLAREVAEVLTARDALAAHADIELGIDLDDVASPWEAAVASAVSFLLGGLLPLLAVLLPPAASRLPICCGAVLVALAATGYLAARLGGAPPARGTLRNTVVGVAAMAVTYTVGLIVGHLS